MIGSGVKGPYEVNVKKWTLKYKVNKIKKPKEKITNMQYNEDIFVQLKHFLTKYLKFVKKKESQKLLVCEKMFSLKICKNLNEVTVWCC